MDVVPVFALHFGPSPDLFPRGLQLGLQWAAQEQHANDDALLESTAPLLCEGFPNVFFRRLSVATDVMQAMRVMRGRAMDDAFAARANLAATAIAIIRGATEPQITPLIRAGAGAVVPARRAVEPLRAGAFSALALLLRHSFPGLDGTDAVVGQFAEVGDLELLDGVREEMDGLPAEVCRTADEFLAASEDRGGAEQDG